MSIIRQTIKRLQKEADKLNPDKNRIIIIAVSEGIFCYNHRNYKTLAELKEKEGIKDSDGVLTIDKVLVEKNGLKNYDY